MKYQSLESGIIQEVGGPALTFDTTQVSTFFASVSFLWTLGIMVCVAATGFVWVKGGLFRMEASEAGIRKSNEEFKRGTLGLLGVLSLFLIIYTINKGLLLGDVGLDALKSGGVTPATGATEETPTGTTPASGGATGGTPAAGCATPEATIAAQSGGNICAGVACRVLTGCNYTQYQTIINNQPGITADEKKMLSVLMCKESSAVPTKSNRNTNGTYDCGLMQVNQPGPCDATSLDPASNIARGLTLLRQKSVGLRTYPGVPAVAGIFAKYNCCSNGTPANDPSADCNTSSGFPSGGTPKWACPIKPGDMTSNMCTVRSYACELTACLNNI